MQDFWGSLRSGLEAHWHKAIDPLHGLTWQTGALFLLLILSAALIATWLLSIAWVWPWNRPLIAGASIRPSAHTYKDHLRLSTVDYLRFHELKAGASFNEQAVVSTRAKDLDRYYVVTVVEKDKRKVVVYRELKLQCPMAGRYQTQQDEIQFDESLLTQVRFENGNIEDDEPDTPVAGRYNVYVRRVRWYDVRHWLTHPNREIRIVIWVTIITTTLPVLLDLLFG
ncbi:MAG: hypothetical protein ABL889_20890 [Terricaulis sp.]